MNRILGYLLRHTWHINRKSPAYAQGAAAFRESLVKQSAREVPEQLAGHNLKVPGSNPGPAPNLGKRKAILSLSSSVGKVRDLVINRLRDFEGDFRHYI